ncbi:MAG TPA: hypothetical protein VFM02_01220 [Candidatus Paceibacterota bacterium]|nr:hypothetical protein [Candidatus Paceibacterota bacterium]
MKGVSKDRGFIKIVLAFILLVIVFAYFGIDFRATVASVNGFFGVHPEVAASIQFVWSFLMEAWTDYVLPSFMWIWDKLNFVFNAASGVVK